MTPNATDTEMITNSVVFRTSLLLSTLVASCAIVSNLVMLITIWRHFKLYQRNLKILLTYQSLNCLLFTSFSAAKCTYFLYHIFAESTQDLKTTTLNCFLYQEMFLGTFFCQVMFSFFFIAFERFWVSKRKGQTEKVSVGFGVLCVLFPLVFLSSPIMALQVWQLHSTPAGSVELPICLATVSLRPLVIFVGASIFVVLEVGTVYLFWALRR